MNRYSQNQVNVTPKTMRDMADAFRKMALICDALAQKMDDEKMPGVWAKSLKTGTEGLSDVGKFVGYVATGYVNETASRGIGDIVGAVAELQRYTNLPEELRDKSDEPKKKGGK